MPALATLLCSHCDAAGLELHAGSQVVCRYCGTVNTPGGVVCPHCEFVNPEGQAACLNCRRALDVACPMCATRNWAGAETCHACGARLDALNQLSTRLGPDPATRLNAQQQSARALKAEEAQAGDRRLAELNAMEARRQAGLRAARARQAAEQRVLLIGTGVVVLIIAAAVLISVLLTALR